MASKTPYVLIAEPNKAIAAALARAATEATKLPCRIAVDGSEGHALLVSEGAPALLITDLTLPKRDGFSLIRGLRRTDPTRKARVLAYSAFPAVRKSAQELHGELAPIDVLAKPLAMSAVDRALRDAPVATATAAPTAPPPLTMRPPAPAPEPVRLERIQRMGIVDEAPPDQELQRIVTDVASSFGVPTALVTVVLENEQWFKSYVGLGGDLLAKRGGPRSWAFCHHVVEGRDALVVPDARENPTFANNQYVKDGTVRGYAGAPIVTPQGDVLGSMCIIDTKPLDIGAEGVARLRLVARRVAGELQLGAARRRGQRIPNASEAPGAPPEREAVLRALDVAMETMPCAVLVVDDARRTLSVNSAFSEMFGVKRTDVAGTRRETLLSRIAAAFADADDAMTRLAAPPNGAFVICEDVLLADGRMVRWSAAPVEIPGGFLQIVNVL